jgi:hypothetical protein
MISYHNPFPVAFPYEGHVPVPGWGFTPNLAGPAMLAVGASDPTGYEWVPGMLILAAFAAGGYYGGKELARRTGHKKEKALWGVVGAAALPTLVAGFTVYAVNQFGSGFKAI